MIYHICFLFSSGWTCPERCSQKISDGHLRALFRSVSKYSTIRRSICWIITWLAHEWRYLWKTDLLSWSAGSTLHRLSHCQDSIYAWYRLEEQYDRDVENSIIIIIAKPCKTVLSKSKVPRVDWTVHFRIVQRLIHTHSSNITQESRNWETTTPHVIPNSGKMNFETLRRIRNISITHHIVRKNKFETPFVLQRKACGAGSGWSRDDGFCGFPNLGLRRGARCAAYCFQLGLHTWSVGRPLNKTIFQTCHYVHKHVCWL